MSGTVSAPAGPVKAASPPDPEVKKLHDLSNSDGFLGFSRHGHMETAKQDLQSLDGARVNATLDGMGKDDIKALGDDISQESFFSGRSGLSDTERRTMFNNLAGKAGGSQLAKLSDGLDRDDKQRLADAVASSGTDATKLDYIKALAPQTTKRDDRTTPGTATTIVAGSPEANAVGTVLSSLRGKAADAGFHSLNPDGTDKAKLNAVFEAASKPTVMFSPDSAEAAEGSPNINMSHSFDGDGVARLLNAAASGTDPHTKCDAFAAGGRVMDTINEQNTLSNPDVTAGEQTRKIADGMTAVLNSDAPGVVFALHETQPAGGALKSYAVEMIGTNRTQELGTTLRRLQHGNDMEQPDAAKYFEQKSPGSTGEPFYQNAQTLGYFAGAMTAGINAITAKQNQDKRVTSDVIGNIASAALFARSAALPATLATAGAQRVATPIVNGLSRVAINAFTTDFQTGNATLKETVFQMALPRAGNPADGPTRPYEGPARSTFDGAYGQVPTTN